MNRKSEKRPLSIVVHGHIGRGNVGDEAMLEVIVRQLRHSFPDSQLCLAYGADTSPKTIQEEVSYFPRTITAIVKKLFKSDLFVIAGGTHLTLFGDNKAAKLAGIIRQLLLILMARVFNNKVLMLSVGIGPLESKSSQCLVALALKLVHFISVRDASSLAMLSTLHYNGPYTRCSDAAYFFPRPKTETKKRKKLGISILPYFASHMRNPGADNDLVIAFAEAISAWLGIFPDGEVYLLPLCSQASDSSDSVMTERLGKLFSNDSRIHNVVLQGSPQIFVRHLAVMTHFIATRYHATLFAHLFALPTLNIAYHEKIQALASEIAIPQMSIFSIEDVMNGMLAHSMPKFCSDPSCFKAQRPSPLFPEKDIVPDNLADLLGIKS